MAIGASIVGGLLDKLNTMDLQRNKKKNSINLASHTNTNNYADMYFLYLFVTSILMFFTMDFIKEERNVEMAT